MAGCIRHSFAGPLRRTVPAISSRFHRREHMRRFESSEPHPPRQVPAWQFRNGGLIIRHERNWRARLIKNVHYKTKMYFRFLMLLLVANSLLCCKDGSKTKHPSLTNDELLQLMGGELFEVTVPTDIKAEQFAGLAIRHSDGSIKTMGCSSPWSPGEVVKIVCFAPSNNELRYFYFRVNGWGSGSISNFPNTSQSNPNMKRTGIRAGERLVRYSVDNTIVISEHPEDDDFDVIFHFQDGKKPNQPTN